MISKLLNYCRKCKHLINDFNHIIYVKFKIIYSIIGIGNERDINNCNSYIRNNRNRDNIQIIQHKNSDKYLTFCIDFQMQFIGGERTETRE